jgi:RNA polymerase sigma factor (sigma-70 family)
MSDLELNEIIDGCRQRHRVSQKRLYDHFYNYAMSVARRYVFDTDLMEEVVNDAFFKVFTKIDLYGGDLQFKAWFRRILVNTAIDRLRVQARLPQVQELDYQATDDNMESTIVASLTRERLKTLVQRLPPSYLTVFNLYVFDEFSHQEISDMLGISVGGSKSNLARARQILRVIFEHEGLLT